MSALLLPPEIVYPESDGQPMAGSPTQGRAGRFAEKPLRLDPDA